MFRINPTLSDKDVKKSDAVEITRQHVLWHISDSFQHAQTI